MKELITVITFIHSLYLMGSIFCCINIVRCFFSKYRKQLDIIGLTLFITLLITAIANVRNNNVNNNLLSPRDTAVCKFDITVKTSKPI